MRNPDGRTIVPGGARLVLVILGVSLSGCSAEGTQPAAAPSSSPASSHTTVMIEQHAHSISAGVDCTSSAAQTTATPAESGDLTTHITAHDDSASVSVAVSDETPPSVDAFAITLKVGSIQYQMPYQPTQSATQVQVTKEGKTYTVTGFGQAVTTGQSDTRQMTFGIHVTCP